MAFKQVESHKHENDVVGLIDVVFILLIFFLVTVVTGVEGPTHGPRVRNLPKMDGYPPGQVLGSLMFRVDAGNGKDEPLDVRPTRVLALFPALGDAPDVLVVQAIEAVEKDRDPDLYFELDYSVEEQAELRDWIGARITKYQGQLASRGQAADHVAVSAIRGTPYRIIEAILDECSREGRDVEIKQVLFRSTNR